MTIHAVPFVLEATMEQIIHTVLHAGLERPVRLLQITDVHLTQVDPADPLEQQEHMIKRREVFRKEGGFPPQTPNEYLEEAFVLAEEQNAFPVVTGDVMDVNCKGNRDEFHRICDGKDFLFCPGSHEFADFCRAPRPDYPERYPVARAQVEAAFPELKFTFDSRVIGGVNVITMDNSRDYFPAEVLEGLQKEAEKGLPMVLFMHDPLIDYNLLRIRPIDPIVRRTPEEYLISDSVIGFIGRCPLVLGTFAGHWHGETERTAPCGAKVYVTPGLFKGICRLIEID